MMDFKLWTDHRPRIEFYVRHGLVPRAPTDAQLKEAFKDVRDKVGALGQIKYYAKHPQMIFPSRQKRGALSQSITAIAKNGYKAPHKIAMEGSGKGELPTTPQPHFDRALQQLFLFSPARFAVQCAFNPWAPIPTSGLNTPTNFLISHIIQTTHPPPVLWDAQVLHPDPGALDELDRRLERALRGRGLLSRVDRALGCREGYFEYVRELIPRLRRFDYSPVPQALKPRYENLVDFLCYAAEL